MYSRPLTTAAFCSLQLTIHSCRSSLALGSASSSLWEGVITSVLCLKFDAHIFQPNWEKNPHGLGTDCFLVFWTLLLGNFYLWVSHPTQGLPFTPVEILHRRRLKSQANKFSQKRSSKSHQMKVVMDKQCNPEDTDAVLWCDVLHKLLALEEILSLWF